MQKEWRYQRLYPEESRKNTRLKTKEGIAPLAHHITPKSIIQHPLSTSHLPALILPRHLRARERIGIRRTNRRTRQARLHKNITRVSRRRNSNLLRSIRRINIIRPEPRRTSTHITHTKRQSRISLSTKQRNTGRARMTLITGYIRITMSRTSRRLNLPFTL